MVRKSAKIQTEHLLLKPYEDSDLEDMVFLLCNDEIKKTFMIPDFAATEDAVKMFYRLKDLSYSDEHFEYGVYLEERLIGFINDVEIDGDTIELGYVIRPDMKGRGYATEVLSAAIKELFRIGYKAVRAGLFEENTASRRVMEKCGMSRIDKTDDIEYRGKNHHCIYFEKKSKLE